MAACIYESRGLSKVIFGSYPSTEQQLPNSLKNEQMRSYVVPLVLLRTSNDRKWEIL